MKQSAILQVFHGKRGTLEQLKFTTQEKILFSDSLTLYDELTEHLTPEQKTMHDKFLEAEKSFNSEQLDRYYAEGFKLGLLLGLECAEK